MDLVPEWSAAFKFTHEIKSLQQFIIRIAFNAYIFIHSYLWEVSKFNEQKKSLYMQMTARGFTYWLALTLIQ